MKNESRALRPKENVDNRIHVVNVKLTQDWGGDTRSSVSAVVGYWLMGKTSGWAVTVCLAGGEHEA